MAAAVGIAVLALSPVMAGAAPLNSGTVFESETIFEPVAFFRFCADAQLDMANMDKAAMAAAGTVPGGISVGGTIYDERADFEFSKSSVDVDGQRIMTVAHVEYADEAKTQPRTIRCKLRTSESLDEGAWPPGAGNNQPGFEVDPYFGLGSAASGIATGVDSSCEVVNQNTIDAVWGSLDPTQQAASPYDPTEGTLVTAPDYPTTSGPDWLGNTPTLSLAGDTLTVSSRALRVPTTTADLPRVKGANYCTFVPPTYLRDVLLGAPVGG